MDNRHNVHDIQNQVSLYFDNALEEKEKKELLSRVGQDPRCSKIFNKEKSFREFIKNNVTRPPVSAGLIQSIKDRIRII